MYEIAVAIAATGRHVELRGKVDHAEVRRVSEAAGAAPQLPSQPHRPTAGDTVFVPEGAPDPLSFAYLALSSARLIMLLLGPAGLFGWPFVAGWSLAPAVEVALDQVALAEHHRAMVALGFELWSPSPAMARRVQDAGIGCTVLGRGRALGFPSPGPKRYDVATLANNRWAASARAVAARLGASVVHHEIPPGSNEQVLRQLGESRVFVHPLRIEGDSRLGLEARAMGAVPVVLSSNPFSVGLDDASGAVSVDSLDAMAPAVEELLSDPERLETLRERGLQSAAAEIDWDSFVARIDRALSSPAAGDPGRQARGVIGDLLMEDDDELNGRLEHEFAQNQSLLHDRASLNATIDDMKRTRIWRAAGAYWRLRDRLASTARRRGHSNGLS